jgi:hypothetical protein
MNTKRLTHSAALGLAVAALAVPAAAAAPQDLRDADQVTPSAEARQTFVTPPADARQDLRNADRVTPSAVTRQELVAPAANARQDLRSPDAVDSAAGRGTDASPDVMIVRLPANAPSASPADGLDWQDAGVGAGALFALGLIGLGGTLLVVHHRRGAVPTAGVR